MMIYTKRTALTSPMSSRAQSRHKVDLSPLGPQAGITLILVLIFLVALSMIAIVGIRNVSTGERVSATERDRSLAFQGAESSGREAAVKIVAGAETSLAKGYYSAPIARGGNADFWRTTSNMAVDGCTNTDASKRFDWDSCASSAASSYGNSVLPQYVIERMPDVVNGAVTERWYRITTRASGGSQSADVILQIMLFQP